ncbi:hypothetical protein L207DRAFT_533896 [Hyaloscypha variabilis F]|uniref:Fungal N-terminal domain-containing protein n=1 Tax=Hyaloscypha variabilis (strain UAMH 11265 / GT02V1 / F) TaxID=1149755 RepID=A0A2J6R7S8_HYAVF|nr:hypothetical protein L207DRAFT_533896 [Hyaloscypha variabilis F]
MWWKESLCLRNHRRPFEDSSEVHHCKPRETLTAASFPNYCTSIAITIALELASSIAGLIGLAGLFVQSASTLYTFCLAIPRVGAEVESVIEEVQRLENVLKSLGYVAEQSKSSAFSAKASEVGELLDKETL